MLTAHEAPLCIIEDVAKHTDIQYALVHLFEEDCRYYSFFKSCVLQNQEVLLDNSIFELKEAFNSDKFAEYIIALKPTYYIVPDVLEDSAQTIESFNSFVTKYPYLPGMKIGAIQGKTYDEIAECYRFMSAYADYIAISFDFSWYQQIGLSEDRTPTSHLAKLERMASGRQKLITMLQADGVWNYRKPHHLLGCSLAKEFSFYKNMPSVRSCDTSNPVIAGIYEKPYIEGIGIREKPSTLLADLINVDLTESQKSCIFANINKFKKLIGR